MDIVCLDLEGVLLPEIWIQFAELTGVDGLRATTRDIADYDELMRMRLGLLAAHDLKFQDIQQVIRRIEPLPGAVEFVEWIRQRYQLVILSDTFYEFAGGLMVKLGSPTLLCHRLRVDASGRVTDYVIRQPDAKRASVSAFIGLNYHVLAAGDSYNDIGMLQAATRGFFYNPPAHVAAEHPEFPVSQDYRQLQDYFESASAQLASASADLVAEPRD